jgi:hypothetical protein
LLLEKPSALLVSMLRIQDRVEFIIQDRVSASVFTVLRTVAGARCLGKSDSQCVTQTCAVLQQNFARLWARTISQTCPA